MADTKTYLETYDYKLDQTDVRNILNINLLFITIFIIYVFKVPYFVVLLQILGIGYIWVRFNSEVEDTLDEFTLKITNWYNGYVLNDITEKLD